MSSRLLRPPHWMTPLSAHLFQRIQRSTLCNLPDRQPIRFKLNQRVSSTLRRL